MKLLRVLETGRFERLGSNRERQVKVRVISATNADLGAMIRAGSFREDLYYRLNLIELRLPPLAERPGDILPLAEHFLKLYGARLGYAHVELAPQTVHALLTYQWPGNIRELENSIHHALLVCIGTTVRPEDLRLPAPRSESRVQPTPAADSTTESLEHVLHRLFNEETPDLYRRIDETVLRVAYDYCEHNQLRTARLLGISRNIVRDRLIRYGLVALPDR